ncbi:SMI1/KNR4 family protein [Asticcacaulis sp.]|uniref:SMI1/KNR4 family protein n=1 Tax=Asticcacaulis sp. TaxID=1872648 RepID=UPI002D175F8C|nr:SMI1/KNR4 family protein [Asticcacaulis sp.]HTM79796.1 SMI1/KNR4 family protein [Asticcacaulis sp.]
MKVEWFDAYTPKELDLAQDMYDIVFSPDLITFLSERHPLLDYNWRTDNEAIRTMLRWPYEGLLFDVENANLWLPDWGSRPLTEAGRAGRLKEIVDDAPKLIPLCGHRYLPAYPEEADNPVFSVYQSDIIYYGTNLHEYIGRESHLPVTVPVSAKLKPIPFWAQFADDMFP